MGRKRILTKEEIFNKTGEVLRSEGISGVHFKKLSSELQVSRSTLYEYFKNKDDLILAYMKEMMDEMDRKINAIPEGEAPNDKLFRLLHIFLAHAETYHIDQMIRELQTSNKNLAHFFRTKIHEDLMETYAMMVRWIKETKQQGIWKDSVNEELIGDLIFHSILFPNRQKLGAQEMAKQLFEMIECGVKGK